MIKITLQEDGLKLKQGIAYCDFCQENKQKECIESRVLTTSFTCLKDNKELKWFKPKGLFEIEKLYWVIEPEYEVKEQKRTCDICKDCIKQLANLIK